MGTQTVSSEQSHAPKQVLAEVSSAESAFGFVVLYFGLYCLFTQILTR
jgi:hypothetical protein